MSTSTSYTTKHVICIIYLGFSAGYTSSKTIPFTSSCKTKTFRILKTKLSQHCHREELIIALVNGCYTIL
jgi:hypothetical protein